MVLEHMGQHIQEAGDPSRAQKFLSQEIGKHASRFHELATQYHLSGESKADTPEDGQQKYYRVAWSMT